LLNPGLQLIYQPVNSIHRITRRNANYAARFRVICGSLFLSLSLFLIGCNEKTSTTVRREEEPANQNTMQTRTSGPLHYVALGDSTGAGVGAQNGGYVARLFTRVLAARPRSKLTNLCLSGATTEDVVRAQLDRAIKAEPDLVTLGIGINDIGQGVSLESFAVNYETIVSRLTTETDAPLILTNIPDTSTAPRIPEVLRPEINSRILIFNEKIFEIALRHGATVFDIYSVTHEMLADHPEYFSADGFHPSDAGYEVWAQSMWPTLERMIGSGRE
jgi:lysophospholipase L1-like esterase